MHDHPAIAVDRRTPEEPAQDHQPDPAEEAGAEEGQPQAHDHHRAGHDQQPPAGLARPGRPARRRAQIVRPGPQKGAEHPPAVQREAGDQVKEASFHAYVSFLGKVEGDEAIAPIRIKVTNT